MCRIYAVYLVFLGMKTIHYPMKDLVGGRFCHFFSFLEPYGAFVGQFHSFFMTVFRYVCLFHSEKMLRHNISPKVTPLLWKYNNFCQILVIGRGKLFMNTVIPHIVSALEYFPPLKSIRICMYCDLWPYVLCPFTFQI